MVSDRRVTVLSLPDLQFITEFGQGIIGVGENNLGLLKQTNGSGEAIPGRPGFDGMGKVLQNFLEMSNVSVVKEMVNMIVAQRAYELNSRAIQTSDNMLATATTLKR